MRLTAYDTFCMYLAIKNHFTRDSYDYFKYQGKSRISKESFLNRRDKYQFQKLCRMLDADAMQDFLVANIIKKSDAWAGDLINDEAMDVFLDYQKKVQSLSYNFGNELDALLENVSNAKELFVVKNGETPLLLTLYMQNVCSLETLVLLNEFVGFVSKFDDKLADDFMWPKISMKIKKLRPFISFDKEKIKKILKDKIDAK